MWPLKGGSPSPYAQNAHSGVFPQEERQSAADGLCIWNVTESPRYKIPVASPGGGGGPGGGEGPGGAGGPGGPPEEAGGAGGASPGFPGLPGGPPLPRGGGGGRRR